MAQVEDGADMGPATGMSLPPISETSQLQFADNAKRQTCSPNSASKKAAQRRLEAPKRREFLSGLINEDLQDLTQWHGMRPHHEQKRFLRSVDMLYKAYSQAREGNQNNKAQVQAAMASAGEGDGLKVLGQSASAPSLPSKPIDVFEHKKRQTLRNNNAGEVDPDNTINKWLEAQSVSSCTTGATDSTRMTRFSQLTKTSSGGSSICSDPGTVNQMHYRWHKRAIGVNRNSWGAADQHNAAYLKDGIPTMGLPDSERMLSQFQREFGKGNFGEKITKEMYANILSADKHAFVDDFLKNAPPEQREKFTGMVRSLQFLNKAQKLKNSTQFKLDYDLDENRRLFRPSRQKPVFEPSQVNMSTIPLGTIGQVKKKKRAPMHQEPQEAPDSPSVSGLGSLPLTPRSLATPLVAGQDLPLATRPEMMATF